MRIHLKVIKGCETIAAYNTKPAVATGLIGAFRRAKLLYKLQITRLSKDAGIVQIQIMGQPYDYSINTLRFGIPGLCAGNAWQVKPIEGEKND